MSDFFYIAQDVKKVNDDFKVIEFAPEFIVNPATEDLMIQGRAFKAVWNEKTNMWSTNESTVISMIDDELRKTAAEHQNKFPHDKIKVRYMRIASSGSIDRWHKFCEKQMRDIYHELDETVTFKNSVTKKTDFVSKTLPYEMKEGDITAYDELISRLYTAPERDKIEWAIGAIVCGDSRKIQKFCVLYGSAGSGKSTILNIIQLLFEGYWAPFVSKDLGSSSAAFALEAFKNNPLVGIEHDGDLSRIEDNTRINSLVSHETMEINEKFKAKYSTRFNTFLFMGTNKPVRITEAKSGLLRRLIDISPSGDRVAFDRYMALMAQIKFELGAIAYHCKQRYLEMGMNYYDDYVPTSMMAATNDFFDFMEEMYFTHENINRVTLNEAWRCYLEYCESAKVPKPMSRRTVQQELKNYYRGYLADSHAGGKHERHVYTDFRTDKFFRKKDEDVAPKKAPNWLIFSEGLVSKFDEAFSDCPAQYGGSDEKPVRKWINVKTKLGDLNTRELHYVKVPVTHIVIDFDIKNENGEKDFELNLAAANKWPETYAELSKSGQGIHLHYNYVGNPEDLSLIFDKDIEVKVFTGNSSLRRKLTKCNDKEIREISSGLPLKEAKDGVVNWEGIENEKHLRALISKNLEKKIHAYTAPSIDHIYSLLEDAYNKGIPYDVTDLRPRIMVFANGSHNQAAHCLSQVAKMKFKSEDPSEDSGSYEDARIIFFDIEVFPNLFLVNWKFEGAPTCVRMMNPAGSEIENLLKFRLVGFNNRKYDNHILYARMMGYSNQELYNLSRNIIEGNGKNCYFSEAYNLSYADIYDFSSKKQSLKKWEIELGIHHQELGLPWDQPVPQDQWIKVAEYCDNDVFATEAVWNSPKIKEDFAARQILSELSGLSVNDTTRQHTTKIIFGNEKHPKLEYTNLEETFPGYEFTGGKNMYRGEDASFGGYVYAEPGMYTNVALLDVASLHPHSIIAMNVFGEYTQRFKDILDARIAIKHHDYDKVRGMLGGKLEKYLGTDEQADALAGSLKIVINSVYGYTSASFDNPFKDPRNKNNIVALRGALFMMTLRDEVRNQGFKVAHIKTDSIKIPNATPEIIQFCMDFAKRYGYSFEHEATYSKLCLVNQAVYIAQYMPIDICQSMYGYVPGDNVKAAKKGKIWTATGTQFQVPYVFKTLFTGEEIVFDDLCETKSVSKGELYLDFDENLEEGQHDYRYVGRVGRFCPIKEGCNGGILYRKVVDDGVEKYHAATGTKGYRWLEAEQVKALGKEDIVTRDYHDALVNEAMETLKKYGDPEWFRFEPPSACLTLNDYMNMPAGESEEGLPWE